MKTIKRWKKPVVLHRTAAGTYTSGVWTPGATTDTTIMMSVQPLKGFEIQILPEGDRAKGSIRLKMDDPFQITDETAYTTADEVQYDGHWYKIISSEKWYGHYEAIALRIENR